MNNNDKLTIKQLYKMIEELEKRIVVLETQLHIKPSDWRIKK